VYISVNTLKWTKTHSEPHHCAETAHWLTWNDLEHFIISKQTFSKQAAPFASSFVRSLYLTLLSKKRRSAHCAQTHRRCAHLIGNQTIISFISSCVLRLFVVFVIPRTHTLSLCWSLLSSPWFRRLFGVRRFFVSSMFVPSFFRGYFSFTISRSLFLCSLFAGLKGLWWWWWWSRSVNPV